MAGTTSPRGRLRRLAELRPDNGRVLSIYFDLDPAEFGTGAARATQVNAVCDEAAKLVESRKDEFDHDTLLGLREDVDRVRELFDPQSMASGGVKGVAVFACGPAGLLETVRTPYPLDSRVEIGETPFIEPLATAGDRERWCVALVSRRQGKVFYGAEDHLEELGNLTDDTHGQHQQGGWSQRRYEESVENDKRDHLDRVADALFGLLRRRPFDRLLVGGPDPIDSQFEERLHPYVKERLAGRVSIDVETANADAVLAAAAPQFEEHRHTHEREIVDRLRAGLGRGEGGLGAAGLPDVLSALNEQRVEVLLLEPGVSKRGWHDPTTGYLAAEPGPSPTGGQLDELEDVIEAAIEKAIEQSAEILVLRDSPDLGPHGGVAAVLRF
jgi:peptide chain release factor subunit 1